MVKLDRYIGIHVFLAILTVLGIIVGLALLLVGGYRLWTSAGVPAATTSR